MGGQHPGNVNQIATAEAQRPARRFRELKRGVGDSYTSCSPLSFRCFVSWKLPDNSKQMVRLDDNLFETFSAEESMGADEVQSQPLCIPRQMSVKRDNRGQCYLSTPLRH